MKKRLVLWGVGDRTDLYMKFNYFESCEITAFIDSYKHGYEYYGIKVYSPDYLKQVINDIDYLIISTYYYSEILSVCIEMGIPREKIILTDIVHERLFRTDVDVIKSLSPMLYKAMQMNQYKLIKMNGTDSCDKTRLVGRGKYSGQEYMSDYFRFRTFEFAAAEIKDRHIEGEVAEFGVFRGNFASLISKKFPDRKIFLFDSFEGFEPDEAKKESEAGYSNEEFAYAHTRTSANTALDNMPYPQQCVLCKGYFPQSITEEAKKTRYAFVSIDVDFEDSIYEGIQFFYARLNEGGYIFIHDYNNSSLRGVRNAVHRYERNEKIFLRKVPLADWAGTLVIVK